jgi:hypothetical protein
VQQRQQTRKHGPMAIEGSMVVPAGIERDRSLFPRSKEELWK